MHPRAWCVLVLLFRQRYVSSPVLKAIVPFPVLHTRLFPRWIVFVSPRDAVEFRGSIFFLRVVYTEPVKIQLSLQIIKWLSPNHLVQSGVWVWSLPLSKNFFLWENLVSFAFPERDFECPRVTRVSRGLSSRGCVMRFGNLTLRGFTLRLHLSSHLKPSSLSAGKSIVTSRLINQTLPWPFPSAD